ncbi:MAG: histone deacetylase family protein [Terriglobales bacterium]
MTPLPFATRPALIYSPGYHLQLGTHVFRGEKYAATFARLQLEGWTDELDVIAPPAAERTDLELVHEPGYLDRLLEFRLTVAEQQRLEIPWTPAVAAASLLAVGGSITAGQEALRRGFAVNLGGGFHHAFPGHGEGFCALHDVAIAIHRLQQEHHAMHTLVVDCDVHQGNGTAVVFAGDPTVFTLSLHQANNYPAIKPPSCLDIELADGIGDDSYLEQMEAALGLALQRFTPDMLWYIAGADPYRDDQLGGLALSMEGLRERDRRVFALARQRHLPIATALAGGYARRLEDTVNIHAQTVRCMIDVAGTP